MLLTKLFKVKKNNNKNLDFTLNKIKTIKILISYKKVSTRIL